MERAKEETRNTENKERTMKIYQKKKGREKGEIKRTKRMGKRVQKTDRRKTEKNKKRTEILQNGESKEKIEQRNRE